MVAVPGRWDTVLPQMDDLFAKELLVVMGKGGVGKTTVATALGTAAAARGQRTIVAEVGTRQDVARSLGLDGGDPGFRETLVSEGLHHISIDPERAMQEYLVDQLPLRVLADTLATSRLFTYLAAATPGLRELLTVGKVWELAQPERRTPGAQPYDLVILDAPATGHGLALLQAPRTFAATARVGPIARQGDKIDATLRDPGRTAVILVTTPEETPVSETLVLRAALREQLGHEPDAVIVNSLLPERLNGTEMRAVDVALAAIGAREGAADTAKVVEDPSHRHRRAALVTARARETRVHRQRAQLRRLRRALDGDVPVITLPLLVTAELGSAEIAELSRRLR